MSSKMRTIGIILLALCNIALVLIWAVNGYEDTWFYITLLLLTIPTGWINFAKK